MKITNWKEYDPKLTGEYVNDELSQKAFSLLNDLHCEEESAWRRRKRNGDVYSSDTDIALEQSIINYSLSVEEEVERQAEYELLYKALASIPEIQARRVAAHFLLDMTKTEIAQKEGVSEAAIRQSIERGLEALKKILEKDFM